MKFVSTRGNAPAVSISEAIRAGAASDGGLYLPDRLPALKAQMFDHDQMLADFATSFLQPFFAGDDLATELSGICAESLNFPARLTAPDPARQGLYALELFHGPTGAFKDFGARFLMACFDRIADRVQPLMVLAATSGDTGGAVGCAAEGRSTIRAFILFPKKRISPFQERQLTCWREPVLALQVDGDFDDCQRLVKTAFADAKLAAEYRLTSANSINVGRLLPQLAYAAHAALRVFEQNGIEPGFIIPTGNLGHGLAVLLARAIGMPIGPVILATNANVTLHDWQQSGCYRPRPSIATLANAMDVGNPSNFERLTALPESKHELRVELVDDEAIRRRVRLDFAASGYVWCPHSATGAEAYARLAQHEQSERPWIVAATAHPFKFRDVIEPIIGSELRSPPALASTLDKPTRRMTIGPAIESLREVLRSEAWKVGQALS